jgi:hypothetical protein
MNESHNYINKEELDKEIASLEENMNIIYRRMSKDVYKFKKDVDELRHSINNVIFWNRFLVIVSIFLMLIECFHIYHD